MTTGAIANINLTYADAQFNELCASGFGIKISDLQTEMVQIMRYGRVRPVVVWPDASINFLKVNQRTSGAHVDHPKVIAAPVDFHS